MSYSLKRQHSLTDCRSAPHRAVAGLLSAAIGAGIQPTLVEDLHQSLPEHLVQIATFNYVHTIVASAFTEHAKLEACIPRDLFVYFAQMHAANRQRNHDARQQLATIGAAFSNEEIDVVVLKGGAEILSPYYCDPAHRFISDLDLLVPESRLQDAADLLQALGGRMHHIDEINLRGHHHLPAIEWDGLPCQVELHRRIGSGASNTLLPSDDIFARSLPCDETGLCVSSLPDRFTHHVLHTQISTPRFGNATLCLRSCADHIILRRALNEDQLGNLRRKFARHGLSPILDGLDALSRRIFHPGQQTNPSSSAEIWATRALRNFGCPQMQKHHYMLDRFKGYAWRFLTDHERRRHYLKKGLSAKAWSDFIAFHRDRLRRYK